MYDIFFIHSAVDGHLGFVHVLAVINSASVNIGVHVSFSIVVSWGHMPSSGISGSYDSSIFSFLKNFHTVLHSDCMNLQPYQQCGGVPLSSHPPQNLLFIDCLMMMVILTSVR